MLFVLVIGKYKLNIMAGTVLSISKTQIDCLVARCGRAPTIRRVCKRKMTGSLNRDLTTTYIVEHEY